MKLSITIFASTIASCSAFVPMQSSVSSGTTRFMSEEPTPEPAAPAVPAINGWKPDPSAPCYGLPGAIAPLGFFDPAGFTADQPLSEVKRIREAEVMHCRVGMMAVVGYLIAENTPTIAFGSDHSILANNMIPSIPVFVMFPFFLLINIAEAYRASRGWKEPGPETLFTLRDNYYPGDLGFDPLGLKPSDPKSFANLQAKELSNGRLAMLAAAGMMAGELATGKPVLDVF